MLGEHNASILGQYLGYPPARVIELETSGVLIARPTDCSSHVEPDVRLYVVAHTGKYLSRV
jgi:hypothetical protein